MNGNALVVDTKEENNAGGTVMTGPKQNGNKQFGYFGGKPSELGDKSVPNGDLHRHGDNWETNPNRCPILLNLIYQIDPRWPTDDDECQDFLHQILVYQAIKQYAEKIGESHFDAIGERFPQIGGYGYNLEEAFTMDLTLLKRP